MINGLFYGITFFSLIPLFATIAAGFDLSFYPENFFLTKKYELSLSTIYATALILISTLALAFVSRKTIASSAYDILLSINKLRKTSIFFLIANIVIFFSHIIDFFYIDHSLHWLERESIRLIPESLKFYINPIFSLFAYVSILCVACSAVIISQESLGKKIYFKWLAFDLILIFTVIYNSGNRWYLALIFAVYFYFSNPASKNKILIFSPFIVFFGGMFSILLVAMRIGLDLQQMLQATFNIENIFYSFLTSIFLITEGINLPALFEISKISLFDPDPLYPLIKILYTPLPGFLVDKPPPFNIYVTYLLAGSYSEWSLNTTLLGIFIYGFGFAAIPLFLTFIFLLKIFEKYFVKIKYPFAHSILFCLLFSGYRFGFEYLLVHIIYFIIILFFLSNKLKSFDRLASQKKSPCPAVAKLQHPEFRNSPLR